MGASQQRKGAAGERELAALLRQYGYDIQRGGFVFGTVPDLVGLPGIHIEVKRAEQCRILDWMSQSKADAEKFKDGMPIVVWRKNHGEWIVIQPFSDWIQIYNNSDFPDSK